MMMMLPTCVECSAKIAMTALRARHAATGLLPDIDLKQRVFLRRSFNEHFLPEPDQFAQR
jgi:hypothetical protein